VTMSLYPQFVNACRRIVTAEDEQGRSVVALNAGPSALLEREGLGALMEVWEEPVLAPLTPGDRTDHGPQAVSLSPTKTALKCRWFVIEPEEGLSAEELRRRAEDGFAAIDGAAAQQSGAQHPLMHATETIDFICVIDGEVLLRVDQEEVKLVPGNVVVQRGVSHAWTALGRPALLLAVLMDKSVVRP
jgi:hypothetical protein